MALSNFADKATEATVKKESIQDVGFNFAETSPTFDNRTFPLTP
jgi:hypothetical protein